MATTISGLVDGVPRLFPALAAAAVCAALAGAPLAGTAISAVACLAMLVFGLPHGSLDLELIRSRRGGGGGGIAALAALYLTVAAAMLTLWRLHPLTALAAFILIAIWHFAEDWEGVNLPLLEWGGAAALLASPTLLNRAALDTAFVALTGSSSGVVAADVLTLVAPVALMLAAVGIVLHWQEGRRGQSMGLAAAVAVMIVLPPVVGFALYFCVFHSPRHFSGALQSLSWTDARQWARVVVPLTLAGLGLAVVLFAVEWRPTFGDQIVAVSFMTLSIVTAPHMLAPRVVRAIDAWRLRRTGQARAASPA
ncbi:MAG TPA: Brp/Blh family beta-carotene 15,15'-dioxygenase [Brevundimonas sp.]|nr:Brp/Blh family beta-carotene 15,15'-dioxygenase [Brevundimonas sp.]